MHPHQPKYRPRLGILKCGFSENPLKHEWPVKFNRGVSVSGRHCKKLTNASANFESAALI